MPVLENPKHELFAQARAKGMTLERASLAAGYTGHRGEASELARSNPIAARILELQHTAADDALVDIKELLVSLHEIRERCMQGEQVFDEEGRPTGEWEFDSKGALKAIELLGKYRGIWKEKRDVEVKFTLEELVAGSHAKDDTEPSKDS